jgi:hypothetical protein
VLDAFQIDDLEEIWEVLDEMREQGGLSGEEPVPTSQIPPSVPALSL